MSTEEAASEDVVAKYKKLLSLARSSLESNQATIAAKDKQIHQLIAALEEEKQHRSRRGNVQGKEDDTSTMPRNLLRRVDVGSTIWILIEYEGVDDAWKDFTDEQELEDFITRTPGAPLIKPPRSLSPTESRNIEEESKKRVEIITEEFRRYKVRAEIARKQKDAETRQALTQGTVLPATPPQTSLDSLALDTVASDELRKYKAQLQDQESKWRTAFERAMKENEQLRTRGSEALIIAQLREQYESCLREKNELQEKVKIYEKVLHDAPSSGSKSLEQAYIELRDEYKEYRRRVQAIEAQRQIEEDLKGSVLMSQKSAGNTPVRDKEPGGMLRSNSDSSKDKALNSSPAAPTDAQFSVTGNGMMESKVKYIRQMVFQYLSCREPEVKLHIESALMAMFRFNDQERISIEERKKEESQDTLTSITNFLGGFST